MTLTAKQMETLYALTNACDAVDYDCGTLCNKACCSAHPLDYGIYLLPGEEKLLQNVPWLTYNIQQAEHYDFPPSWRGPVVFAHCAGHCHRNLRPIQCRTFPAAPHLHRNQLLLIKETLDLSYRCPLLDKSLNQNFIEALFRTWQQLLDEPLIKDLVAWDSCQRIEDGLPISVLYPTHMKEVLRT